MPAVELRRAAVRTGWPVVAHPPAPIGGTDHAGPGAGRDPDEWSIHAAQKWTIAVGRFGPSVDGMTATLNTPVQIPARMAPKKLTPDSYRAMIALDGAAAAASLETPLQELVRIRASQLNGCVYCIDMHTTDARNAGETEQRLYALSAWQESSQFTARERAALRLTEAVTLIADSHVPDADYAAAAAEFTEVELAELLWTIIVINAWNRLAVTSRLVPGT